MNQLRLCVESPLAIAFGWTLVHSLWQGMLLCAALAVALAATRSPRTRYSCSCLALIAMLAAFGLTLAYLAPVAADNALNAHVTAFASRGAVPAADEHGWPQFEVAALVAWLAPFWLAGVLAACLAQVGALAAAHRVRTRGVCTASEDWQQRLNGLALQLHLTQRVQLLESCLTDMPVLLGHLRPVILIPVGLLAGLPVGQIEAILLHELAHIRRRDYLMNTIQRLVETLLFYHPAAWWISHVIRAEREACCDDEVVLIRGNRYEYAATLVALERVRSPLREATISAAGGSLVKRIQRLLRPNRTCSMWAPVVASAVLTMGIAATLAAWQVAESHPGAPVLQGQADTSGRSPYRNWLDEDVLYICTDHERATFLALSNDPERERFIEQFWLRRDPTPGTAANEFKVEHYRRIQVANERFPISDRAGWHTDRGRIYIVYGPPDAIDNRAHTPQAPYPLQTWRYRHMEGIGDDLGVTFVDREGSGDFRIVPGNDRL